MDSLFGIPMDSLAIGLLAASGLILLGLVILGWRNRVMVRLGLRNIPRRRTQTVLIVFGLMLSTLIVSAAFGTGDTMTYSFRAIALDQLGEADELINTGGAMSTLGPNIEIDIGGSSGDTLGGGAITYFDIGRFESLSDQVAQRQAAGDENALLIEALAPAILESGALVINRTGRQSEPQVSASGYEPVSADGLADLFTLAGRRVTLAELGPGEVYLKQSLAEQLAAEPGHELNVYLTQTPIRVTVRAVVRPGGLPGDVLMPLEQVQAALGRSGQINTIVVSNVGDAYDGAEHSTAVTGLLRRLVQGTRLRVHNDKAMILFAAELIGSVFTTLFIAFGSFSIAAALLLIFLIFVMLAAERTREMGMARAVGTRRRHLIQMFVFEGTAYDLVAAAVGALLGAGIGLATVGVLARSLQGIAGIGGFRLQHHLEPRSVIVAYCLGLLLTFLTVTISSWRVSRLNIVSAIRDLPPPPNPDAGLRALFVQQWHYLADAFRQLLRLRPHRTLKRILWDGPISTLAFLWGLVVRGPLVVLIGFLSLRGRQGNGSAFLYGMGVSLIVIGLGLTLRWVLGARHVRPSIRDRIAFSFAGLGLLVFWLLPMDTLSFLDPPSRSSGSEMFVLAGIMMIAGAVWTIVYNSELLLGLFTWLFRPVRRLLPVVRTAIAYPMQHKVRTGLTIAMFALVIFMLVFMSVFVHIINQALGQTIDLTGPGDYDIEAGVSKLNPIPDLKTAILAAPGLNPADYAVIRRQGSQFISTEGGQSYFIKLADGVDAEEAARALESAFLEQGMETVVLEEQVEAAKGIVASILGLMQSFMGMGLVVGSASIGIVSARAVVERRQQIGVLRAIGYRGWMIQWSFLIEASFVALLGILLGIGLGLVLARSFYQAEIASGSPGMSFDFSIPWTTLGIIVAIAYGTSLLTTFLPSWQAARIYPAEALRYE